jgi:transposase-like protein
MTEINCKGTYVLICPYCEKNQRREHFDLSDYEDNYECSYCHKTFEYEREVIPLYTSKRKKECEK